MATDNTQLNSGVGGDTIRDLARQAGSIKTQVIQLDLGGASTNSEVLITAGQQLSAVSVPVVIASDQSRLPVRQGIDTGRNARIFMLDTYTNATATDTLMSVIQWYGNAAVTATTTPAVVPAGKTLRLTNWHIVYSSLASAGHVTVRLRINVAGTVLITSPIGFGFSAGSLAAVAGVFGVESGEFPEGFEIPAGSGIGFSLVGYNATGTQTAEGGVRFVVSGFEY